MPLPNTIAKTTSSEIYETECLEMPIYLKRLLIRLKQKMMRSSVHDWEYCIKWTDCGFLCVSIFSTINFKFHVSKYDWLLNFLLCPFQHFAHAARHFKLEIQSQKCREN